MDSPCIKQTVCKVLKIFQHGKYLVAYVLKTQNGIVTILGQVWSGDQAPSYKTLFMLNST